MKLGDRGEDPIERLRAGALVHRRPQKTRNCPEEDRLRMLLPGQVEPEEAGRLLDHAAECDWCGTVLREAAQDLTGPPTDEEEELAAKARLSDPGRRRELAGRIVRGKKTAQPWSFILQWWPAAGLATAALVGGVAYQQWTLGVAHTAGLLASAYTKQRTLEMRLPGAKWGPVRTQLGTETSSFNEPRDLIDARSNISRGMDAHPDDPRWLQLAGQADLQEGKEEAAIEELERARSLRPADATILVDLGAAYYQKAAKTDDPESYSKAYERLSEGVRLKPGDPALVFDQALAAEHIQTPGVAQKAWETYLKLDSGSGFAAEARAHLDSVKKNSTNSGPTPARPPLKH
ncbi:MAG TPA: tetratricopeptide repeat protein [Bryobacteraceae bacterium]|nr:tetratricopeptide repeat protein [Bryobacteraceae bacterium]